MWDLNDLTIKEAEALFAEPLLLDDGPVFCEDELIAVYRRHTAKLVAALEKLARLGNGEHYGNSDGNMIARAALLAATTASLPTSWGTDEA
jgi:hypothetical protein